MPNFRILQQAGWLFSLDQAKAAAAKKSRDKKRHELLKRHNTKKGRQAPKLKQRCYMLEVMALPIENMNAVSEAEELSASESSEEMGYQSPNFNAPIPKLRLKN